MIVGLKRLYEMSRLSICVCGIFVFMVLGFSFAAIRFEYRPDEYALGLWHFSERYDNAVEDEAENKIQTVIESEIEWEKDGWNKKVRGNSLVLEGKTVLALPTKEKADNKFLTSEKAIMVKAWGNFTELTGWNLIGTYRAGTVETIFAWTLAPVIMSCCVVVVLGADRELPPKKGKLWSPGLKWKLKNSLSSGNPFDLVATVTFRHESGMETRETEMFYDSDDIWEFRFLGTRTGRWTFYTASKDPDLNGWYGAVEIKANNDLNAKGLVTHHRAKWMRSATGEVFVPQFVMAGTPGEYVNNPALIDAHIETFIKKHGFTGLHIPVFCRWFDIDHERTIGIKADDPNPDWRTFDVLETIILKTYAAGGTVHLWMWGDSSRDQNPKERWGLNGRTDRRLQRYIAARLGPIPGWTLGYGYDLWEWVDAKELAAWYFYMHEHLGWKHMLSGRVHQHGTPLDQYYEGMDYSGYESHRPDYETYVATIEHLPEKPSFQEDRFRIRRFQQYHEKDYNLEMTRRGLWYSAMVGGVANIWGNLIDPKTGGGQSGGMSFPYPKPEWIRTHADFFRNRFQRHMTRANELTDGYCLKTMNNWHHVFYKEDAFSIRLDLSEMLSAQPAVAIDCKKAYEEIELGTLNPENQVINLPRTSDWAIAVGTFENVRVKYER